MFTLLFGQVQWYLKNTLHLIVLHKSNWQFCWRDLWSIIITLVHVNAPVAATTSWWLHFSAPVVAKKGKKIYTCWLYDLFINLHLSYLRWHLAHRPPVTLQFMALPSNWWYNSWFGLQIQHSSGVLPWKVLFSSVTA